MKMEKLTKFLECIAELNEKLGDEISQITVEQIAEHYREKYGEITDRTIYNYLNETMTEWVGEENKTVKSFVMSERTPTSNSLPNEYLVNESGEEIPPKDYPIHWAYPKGEKTLKAFHLTEKGKKLLELNER